jgi:hypothetical protein
VGNLDGRRSAIHDCMFRRPGDFEKWSRSCEIVLFTHYVNSTFWLAAIIERHFSKNERDNLVSTPGLYHLRSS